MPDVSVHPDPWELVRRWPATHRLGLWLDRPPGHLHPVLRLGSPRNPHTLHSPHLAGLHALIHPGEHWRLCTLAYELGRELEPVAKLPHPPCDDRGWSLGQAFEFPWTIRFDLGHHTQTVEGRVDEAAEMLSCPAGPGGGYDIHLTDPEAGRPAFRAAVERVLSYIAAGDVYQVNLTHRLTGTLVGCPRAFAADLLSSALPWQGACLETQDALGRRRVIVSASPELFLRYDAATRRVTTRPMKGTRPHGGDERELASSPKDRAELNMIIDLMRNDLGRVCSPGTMRVESAINLEHHGHSVIQSTGTVSGTLRPGLEARDLFAACFPPGSVTGAPKIRAMQIIEELEPVVRGPYCGCIAGVGHDGSICANVAIRTALLTATDRAGVWTLDFPVGAGIVADSDPDAEWAETLTKADVLLRLAGRSTSGAAR